MDITKQTAFAWPEGNPFFEISPLSRRLSGYEIFYSRKQRHACYELIWVTQGSGTCIIDLEKIVIKNDTIFCLIPGQAFQIETGDDAKGFIIRFNEIFLNMGETGLDLCYHPGLLQLFAKAAGITLEQNLCGEMNDLAGKMVREFDNPLLFKSELLRIYLKIFLIYLTRQSNALLQTMMQNRNVELVKSFTALVEKNFKTIKRVNEYAKGLYVTPNYLNEIVKKVTGHSAGQHIRQRVVLEAKRQATYSGTCMKEIAWDLGFGDIAHFSKFFKTTAGISFTSFKKNRSAFSVAAQKSLQS
jgi:AraC family transcriptional activator of pobA